MVGNSLIVGDVQGCYAEASRLIGENKFPAVFVGDLVNRGPDSLATLRWAINSRHAAILGNHDLYLMVCATGTLQPKPGDTIGQVLESPDRDDLIAWLRQQPLALMHQGHLLVHAGVVPQWSVQDTLERAAEVEAALRGNQWQEFLHNLWGNVPLRWDDDLRGWDRLRCIVNILTRIRYVRPDGTLDLLTKESMSGVPAGYMPWFDVPERKTADTPVVCGHWSTMGLINRPNLIGLDTGCVWGGKLTAVQLNADWTKRTFLSVPGPGHKI